MNGRRLSLAAGLSAACFGLFPFLRFAQAHLDDDREKARNNANHKQ